MPKNQKGFAHILLLILLLAGIALGVYLVQQKTNLLPKAFLPGAQPPEIAPSTSLALIPTLKTQTLDGSSQEENVVQEGSVNIFQGLSSESAEPSTVRLSYYPGEEILVKLYAASDIDEANLFVAKIKFDKDLLEVQKINYDRTFINNWVEQNYDNSGGTISLVGGVPSPGYKTTPGNPSLMATIIFKAKKIGSTTISFTDESVIYRNSDNQNILQIKVDSTISITEKPEEVCVQVITPAKDPKTGECKEFPTPCDVPEGWVKVDKCEAPPPSCEPRPACLDATPPCLMPEPPGGWCPPSSIKIGDGNKDGKINLVDMSVLLTYFNKTGNLPPIDMNNDGVINTFDFSLMRKLLLELGVIKDSQTNYPCPSGSSYVKRVVGGWKETDPSDPEGQCIADEIIRNTF